MIGATSEDGIAYPSGVTSGDRTAHPSGAPKFTQFFYRVRVTQFLVSE